MEKSYDDELSFVCDFYKEDLPTGSPVLFVTCTRKICQLEAQLPMLRHLVQEAQETSSHEMPATYATSERSFSVLRRVKTYLRTTMTQNRLNHLMVLHVHKVRTDSLDLMSIAREFVTGREGRLRMFGDCRQ